MTGSTASNTLRTQLVLTVRVCEIIQSASATETSVEQLVVETGAPGFAEVYEIDPGTDSEAGGAVLIRPDGYVGLVGRRAQVASTRLHSLSRRFCLGRDRNTSESELAMVSGGSNLRVADTRTAIGCKRDQRHARADRTARLGQVKVPADYCPLARSRWTL